MPQAQRIRIVIGLSVCFTGLAVGLIGPGLVALAMFPDLSPTHLENRLDSHIEAIHRAGTTASVVGFVGLGLAAVGAASAFVVWARWFVGRTAT